MTRIGPRLPFGLVVLLGWLAGSLATVTSGAWWLVAVAPRMIDERSIRFATDRISDEPIRDGSWVIVQWFPALVLHGAHEAAGLAGLVALGGALGACLTSLVYVVCRSAADRWSAAAATGAALLVMVPLGTRAELFGGIAAAGLLLAMWRGRWWLAPLAIVLWVNVHGSWPLAGVLCLFAAIGAGGMSTERLGGIRRRAAWLATCAAATLCSPLGVDAVSYVRRVQSSQDLQVLTPLWAPQDPVSLRATALVLIVGIAAWGILGRSGRPWALVQVLAFALLGMTAVRHQFFFAIVAAPFVAMGVAQLARDASSTPFAERIRRPGMRRVGLLVSSAAVGALLVAAVVNAPGTTRSDRAATAGYPHRLLEQVDGDRPLVTTTGFGNYAALKTGATVFVDSRLERYSPSIISRYIRMRDGEPDAVAAVAGCSDDGGAHPYQQALLSRWYDDQLLDAAGRGSIGRGDERVDVQLVDREGDWYLLRLSCPDVADPAA